MESSPTTETKPVLTPLTKVRPRKPRGIKREDSPDYEPEEIDDTSSIEEIMPSTSEVIEDEEVADLTNNSPKTPNRRKRAADGLIVDSYGPYHFKKDTTTSYMPYVPYRWTPQNTYRMPTDIILDTIRRSGTEGLGRYELGQVLGYDASTKTGGRKVTNYTTSCMNENPDHIGQFQKMNGRVRTIRYFWKENEAPERFEQLLQQFHQLAGIPCPFKIGEVIKFPEKNLNTLRVSDITLKRFNHLLKMVNEQRVVVTLNRVIKHIQEVEWAEGYKFQIDKKSVMKCLLALQNKGLARVYETNVKSDNINYQVHVVCHGSIKAVDDPEVCKGIQDILDQYNSEGRLFPHGQPRYFKKRPPADLKTMTEFDGKIEDVDEDMTRSRTIKDRYHFFRLQVLRNSWKGKNAKDGVEELEVKDAETTLDGSQFEDPDEVDGDVVEEDPEQAMNKLFAQNPTVPSQKKRSTQYYFGRDTLGYQGKTIRLLILHEMAYHFVHGHPDGTTPNVFELFPPTQAFDNWEHRDQNTANVYHDEESCYRFMPPQPQYEGVDRGWFMVQDFLAAMPLSIFVLANYVPTSIDRAELMVYLQDPIKRHLCIGYLPNHIREILLKEKKVHKQLQHAFLMLGAMKLMAIGPNPSPKRFPGASSDVFYVAKKTHLYDTSTSAKGYSTVNPSVGSGYYVTYEYEFKSETDVILYWHHLRAIVQSTALGFRLEDIFDRKTVEHDYVPGIEKLYPRVVEDGVAGFDSALFIHLKRHWDLCTIPHATVSWFVGKFKKCANDMRRLIESRVKSVNKDWARFTRLSMNDVDFMRSSDPLKVEYPSKERKLDSVDLVSSSARISVRCRFSSKERDQLIMIRAVGFFLNPVYRFWLDPTVLRDLMHEFVPESRNKTVQSLMACGVRELVRAHRLAYLQRVVRNLSTFPEMRRLRTELCSTPVAPGQSKTEFFKEAFRIAMRLLFVDNDRIPSTTISDKNFRIFLEKGRVAVTKEITVSNAVPHRSQKPVTYQHIQHCVASNILISVLIHTKNGAVPDRLLEQVPPSVLQTVLQSLRSDGLVSRSRTLEAMAELANKKDATLSYYFRHFFAHRFHSELINGTGRLMEEVDDPAIPQQFELEGDGPEVIVAATNTFYAEKFDLEMTLDDDVLDAFQEKIRVHLEKQAGFADPVLPSSDGIEQVINYLDKSRIVLPILSLDDFIHSSQFELNRRREIRAICHVIKAARQVGITLKELSTKVKIPVERIKIILDDLDDGRQILAVGVDEKRWVRIEYEQCWTVLFGDKRWCPRPWVSPEGTISLPVVRWIAESVLLQIIGKLGILLEDVITTFEFAVQPIAIREIIGLLEELRCIEIIKQEYTSTKLASPFSLPTQTQEIIYIHPLVDGLERFSRTFHEVELMPLMTSKAS
uniref:B-block_TFIIIC domain-containing protein n=1 Tax=Caenorhabditis tropicalis TaxID=1561998 RepID=A0A1I7TQH7_9PELO